jgi:hypothetical protein
MVLDGGSVLRPGRPVCFVAHRRLFYLGRDYSFSGAVKESVADPFGEVNRGELYMHEKKVRLPLFSAT